MNLIYIFQKSIFVTFFNDCAFMFVAISLIYSKLLCFGSNITLNENINSHNEIENANLNIIFLRGKILYYLLNIFIF